MENKHFNRPFAVFSSVDDDTHCFIVLKDGADGFEVMDGLNQSAYIEALSCNRKASFVLDLISFDDCAVIEVAYKEDCRLRELLSIEAVANAEVMLVLSRIDDARQ